MESQGTDELRLRILVVESDQGLSELLMEMLTHFGHEVTSVGNAKEAWVLLEQRQFDLMLAAYSLREFDSTARETNASPQVDGLALAIRARENNPNVKVILLTGYDRKVSSNVVRDGIVDLIVSKPFNVSEIEENILALFADHR
jgi:CheY-like chemotaxis protein